MALFRRSKQERMARHWAWDPAASELDGDQLWSLLANAIYYRASGGRLDVLGGGLNLDWKAGLSASWGIESRRDFDRQVATMFAEGDRAVWADDGSDGGDDKLAWDYCRIITLAGGAAMADLIDDAAAWQLVHDAADGLADRFDSWHELGWNYVEGRLLWLQDQGIGNDPSQEPFDGAAHELTGDTTSPWHRVGWDRSRGLVIDDNPYE